MPTMYDRLRRQRINLAAAYFLSNIIILSSRENCLSLAESISSPLKTTQMAICGVFKASTRLVHYRRRRDRDAQLLNG